MLYFENKNKIGLFETLLQNSPRQKRIETIKTKEEII